MSRRYGFSSIILISALLCPASCTTGRVPVPEFRLVDQSFTAAETAYRSGQYQDAVHALQSFLALSSADPRIPEARLRLGQSYFALKDINPSMEELNRVIHEFPDTDQTEQARLLISRIHYDQGNTDSSLAELRILLRASRNRGVAAEAYLLRGRIFVERGDTALGLSQWQKSLSMAGEQEEIRRLYREMVRIMEKRAVSDKVLIQIAGETPRKFPGDISLFVMGKRRWEDGDPIKASMFFEKFASLFPGHPLSDEAKNYIDQVMHTQSLSLVRIGCILPLSGRQKDIGSQVLQGVRVSVDRMNASFPEKRIELVVKDSGDAPEKAKAEMEALALDPGVMAVIGPLMSRSVAAAAPVAENAHLPVITPTATAEEITKTGTYIFRNAMTNEAQARGIARYAVRDLALHTFVVLYPDDYYGRELKTFFVNEVEALGGEVICFVSYERGAVDYGPQIRSIIRKDMQMVLSRNADMIAQDQGSMDEWGKNYFPSFDAVYLPGYAEDVGLIAPQLAYYNISSVQLLGSHHWNSVELIRRGERFVEGAVFADGFFAESPHTDIAEFVAEYRKTYGEEPTLFSAQAYDAADMILQTINKGSSSREEIRTRLLAQKGFPGISGLTRVLASGDVEKEIFLIRVENGSFRQIN
ncbi:MAG: penicillin-binding protein activator [bacterium]